MAKDKTPATPAVRQLKAAGVKFIPRPYKYEERGGTRVAARELGVDEHLTIKTLVMQTEANDPLIILMHGDQEVSTKALARQLKVKAVSPCPPQEASKHTGYQVGGTSPFGTRKKLPVYIEKSILELDTVYVNGGKRGFLVQMPAAELARVLGPTPVEASQA